MNYLYNKFKKALFFSVLLCGGYANAQAPPPAPVPLNGIENLEVMILLLKLEQIDKDMRPLQEQLLSLSTQQQVLIRQLRDFENKAIVDHGLTPREAWFFSSSTRTLNRVSPPTPGPIR